MFFFSSGRGPANAKSRLCHFPLRRIGFRPSRAKAGAAWTIEIAAKSFRSGVFG
jgi:hypothetical protein